MWHLHDWYGKIEEAGRYLSYQDRYTDQVVYTRCCYHELFNLYVHMDVQEAIDIRQTGLMHLNRYKELAQLALNDGRLMTGKCVRTSSAD